MATEITTVEQFAEKVFSRVSKNIVFGGSLGVGFPQELANALFWHAEGNRDTTLEIFSGLTVERPRATGLEERLYQAIWQNVPGVDYFDYIREHGGDLPRNVEVTEFFLHPWMHMDDPALQRLVAPAHFCDVPPVILDHGCNVLGVLANYDGDKNSINLGTNPDAAIRLIRLMNDKKEKEHVEIVAQILPDMPVLPGATLPRSDFTTVIDNPAYYRPVFAAPNKPISLQQHAIGLYSAMLVKDGGSIQIGYGSVGLSTGWAMMIRHTQPEIFAGILDALEAGKRYERLIEEYGGTAPFTTGLTVNSEYLFPAAWDMHKAGIIRGRGGRHPIDFAFTMGSPEFYDMLRNDGAFKGAIRTREVAYTNALDHKLVRPDAEDLGTRMDLRNHLRAMNSTIKVGLDGSAYSHKINGKTVSGSGGQEEFVRQTWELWRQEYDARSILSLRSTIKKDGKLDTNILFYTGSHSCTVPEQQADIVITEYGIADLRGKNYEQRAIALISIVDAEFQEMLWQQAQEAGMIKYDKDIRDYVTLEENTEKNLRAKLAPFSDSLGPYPYGSGLVGDVADIGKALKGFKTAPLREKYSRLRNAWQNPDDQVQHRLLETLGLGNPKTMLEKFQSLIARAAFYHSGIQSPYMDTTE